MYETNYHRAGDLAEAARLFGEASDARYLAGGQTLIPTMKQRLAAPSRSTCGCLALGTAPSELLRASAKTLLAEGLALGSSQSRNAIFLAENRSRTSR